MSKMKKTKDSEESPIEQSSEKLGGKSVFSGTRVPVKNLFDYITEGYSLREFLKDHPSVNEEQAREVLVSYSRHAFE